MTTITAAIQLSSIPGYLGILLIAAYLWRHEPGFRGLLVMPALWALYAVVFYAFLFTGRLTPEALLLWGAIHRWIAMFMVFGGMVVNLLVLRAPPVDAPPDGYPDDGYGTE